MAWVYFNQANIFQSYSLFSIKLSLGFSELRWRDFVLKQLTLEDVDLFDWDHWSSIKTSLTLTCIFTLTEECGFYKPFLHNRKKKRHKRVDEEEQERMSLQHSSQCLCHHHCNMSSATVVTAAPDIFTSCRHDSQALHRDRTCIQDLWWSLWKKQTKPFERTWISCGVSQISQRTSLCLALGSPPGSWRLRACSRDLSLQTSYVFQYPAEGPSRRLWTFYLDPAERDAFIYHYTSCCSNTDGQFLNEAVDIFSQTH